MAAMLVATTEMAVRVKKGMLTAVEAVMALREARGTLAGQPVQKDHRRASQPPSLNHLW